MSYLINLIEWVQTQTIWKKINSNLIDVEIGILTATSPPPPSFRAIERVDHSNTLQSQNAVTYYLKNKKITVF